MRRRIVFSLIFVALFFVITGTYIIMRIETSTSALDKLIQLHQVEILREDLLLKIKRVQSNLILKNTRHARGLDIIIEDVKSMDRASDKCFECHHRKDVVEVLKGIKDNIEEYKGAISNVLMMRANIQRIEAEEDNAYNIGERLKSMVEDIIVVAGDKLERNTKDTLKKVSNIKRIIFFIMFVMPFGVAFLVYVLVKGFTTPMQSLLYATRRLKEGDLDYRIKGLKYEFGELAESFNEMAHSLKEQMYQMQQIEQIKVCGELATGLAHEIKNPLAGIKLSMEILVNDPSISPENKDVLIKVISEIKRIELLLKELLSLAKPPKLNFEEVNIHDVLESALLFSSKEPTFKKSVGNIKIERRYEDIPKITADPMQLQQVFMNLILNAIDEMPEGGTIFINTSYNKDNTVNIEISDTGKGIDEGIMDSIFKPFFTTKPRGTGLGLAVTKKIVEQHGGTISVRNNPEGGATFTVLLPLNRWGEKK
jgi:signal transduction histidine kinase